MTGCHCVIANEVKESQVTKEISSSHQGAPCNGGEWALVMTIENLVVKCVAQKYRAFYKI